MRIVSLNALKLRIETPQQRSSWQKLFKALCNEDVIVLQEVPANKELFHRRTSFALEALNTHTVSGRWAMLASEPSGASAADRCLERHVIFYQTTAVEVVKATTLHLIAQLRMCHARRWLHTFARAATTWCSCRCTCHRTPQNVAPTKKRSCSFS